MMHRLCRGPLCVATTAGSQGPSGGPPDARTCPGRAASSGRLGAVLAATLALAVFPASKAHAQVATGSYTGDGVDNRNIATVGFQPDVVIIKVNYDNIADDNLSSAVIRTASMSGDNSKPMKGLQALTANLIQSFLANGFQVGNDLRVNAAGASCGGTCTYYWVAFKADVHMVYGTYAGNGGTQSFTGFGFSPEYVIVLPVDTNRATHRSPAGGARSDRFHAGGAAINAITSLDASGFTVNDPLYGGRRLKLAAIPGWEMFSNMAVIGP